MIKMIMIIVKKETIKNILKNKFEFVINDIILF